MKNELLKEEMKYKVNKLKNLFKYTDKLYTWIGFFILAFLVIINILIMTFYLVDSNYEYNLSTHAYVDAVLPGQDIGSTLQLGIVRIEETNFEELNVGEEVIVYGDFSLDVYWVETVVSVDAQKFEVASTYDQNSVTTFSKDEILGTYVRDANFMGTIYYSASFTRGFIFLTITHGIILFSYYYVLLYKKD
jgi:hypothetical protein